MTSVTSASGLTFDMDALKPGTRFDTEFEEGCRVVTQPTPKYDPEPPGGFDAYDSEGVLCSFHVVMVARIHR